MCNLAKSQMYALGRMHEAANIQNTNGEYTVMHYFILQKLKRNIPGYQYACHTTKQRQPVKKIA